MSEALFDFWLTWYQPLIGALHVLGIAWFGGALFADAPLMRRIGIVWMVATGLILFTLNTTRIYGSTAFRIKMVLLAALLFIRGPRWLVLSLWAGVILAARLIAYF
jgi:hypothetical protein